MPRVMIGMRDVRREKKILVERIKRAEGGAGEKDEDDGDETMLSLVSVIAEKEKDFFQIFFINKERCY